MNFQIITGANKGETFEVTHAEVTIGRKKDCTVVIKDDSASGLHVKITPAKGDFLLEDCGSVNGTEINGKTVTQAILQPGDVITIGGTKIHVSDAEVATPAKSGSKTRSPASGKKGGASMARKILAVVLVLAVVGVVIAFLSVKKIKISPGVNSQQNDAVSKIFRLTYEKVSASKDNIFRYEIHIENGTLLLSIDDLRQNRHVKRSKAIEPVQIDSIRGDIHDQQIFSLPPSTEGKSEDVLESSTLSVVSRGTTHEVKVVNRILPDNFKRVCSMLEQFVENEFGISAAPISLEDSLKRAEEASLRARKLYEQRFVKPENLSEAIKAFDEVIWYLDTIEPKPKLYQDAIHGKQLSSEELDQQIKDHEFRAVRAIQLKEWTNARDELLMIIKKIPDPQDKRNQNAQQRLFDVEKRISPK